MKKMARAFAALAGAVLIAGAAAADHLTVEANKSKAIRLKSPAAAIVVGNPNLADVAVHSDKLIFVTGKTYGTTNLLIFDENGRQIYSNDIVVTASPTAQLVVNRGGAINTYDCADTCRRTLAVGDEHSQFQQIAQQNQSLKTLND